MKITLLAVTTLALVAGTNLSPAMAQGPKPSGTNGWPGIAEHEDRATAAGATITPRYEFQYGYDHHGAWRGHWVLVR